MKRIKLTQNKWAIVDDEDYERLNQHKWYFHKRYAIRVIRINKHKKTIQYMHWVVIGKPKKGFVTDHINGDGLDNRRGNLRICTQVENRSNSTRNKNNTSGYKGVMWRKKAKKWVVKICVNYRLIHLGYFDDIKEAAKAYNDAAIKYHKKFARLNVID